MYSNNVIGAKGGPSRKHVKLLERWMEDGYVCGNKVAVKRYFVQQKHRCGDFVESQYYNPDKVGARGGRIVTTDVCAICYSQHDIVSAEEIKTRRDVGGKNPLLVCRACFDLNVKIPTSGGSSNKRQKKSQQKKRKKRQLHTAVAQGRRKDRCSKSTRV